MSSTPSAPDNNLQVVSNSLPQIYNNLLNRFATLMQTSLQTLDSNQSSFVSFIFNQLSILIADTMFFIMMVARENSLVTAQIPDTIYNWASYIDYTPNLATPAQTNVTITIIVTNGFNSIIPSGFGFSAGNIVFTTNNTIYVNLTNGISIYYTDVNNIEYPIPFNVTYLNSNNPNSYTLSFTIPVTQQYLQQEEFTIPSLQTFQTYSKTLQLPEGTYPVSVQLFVTDNNNNVTQWFPSTLVQATSADNVFQTKITSNNLTIEFGNGIQGAQPSGMVTANIYVTNGSSGNVLAGTITGGDTLYSSPQSTSAAPLPIIYTVTNNNDVTGGVDPESLESVRTNAPISLSMLQRIVSANDYTNILEILGINSSNTATGQFMLPILKRSDLTVNDIYLYIVPIYNNAVVPADSIAYDITDIFGTNQTEIIPTQQLTAYNPMSSVVNETNWTNLFLIELDYQKMNATYYYLEPNITLQMNSEYISSSSTNTITDVTLIYNMYDLMLDTYNVNVYTNVTGASNVVYTQEIIILQGQTYNTYQNTIFTHSVTNQYVFNYNFTRQQLSNISNFQINTYENGVLTTTYYTNFNIMNSAQNITYSYIVNYNNRFYLLDVPVIETTYIQNMSITDQFTLFDQLVGQFMSAVNNMSARMMNTTISVKFARTFGTIVNNLLSTPDYYTQNILYGSTDPNIPQNPTTGFYYAVSDPIAINDPWYAYGGYLAVWTGNEWNFIRPGIGTIIKNSADNNLYSSDGRRWFVPNNITLPLNITLEVHPTVPASSVYSSIISTIINYVNSLGISGSLYLSDVISLVQQMQNIGFVRPILPLSDIVYKGITDNLTQEMLYFFTPEYIYTNSSNINLLII